MQISLSIMTRPTADASPIPEVRVVVDGKVGSGDIASTVREATKQALARLALPDRSRLSM